MPWAKFLGSGRFCFISISKFGSFKNPFTMIVSLSKLYFRSKQKEKDFCEPWAPAQVAENNGDDWGLTKYLWWGMYTSISTWPLTKFTRSSRSTKFNNIPHAGFLQIWEVKEKHHFLKIFWQVVNESQGMFLLNLQFLQCKVVLQNVCDFCDNVMWLNTTKKYLLFRFLAYF